MQAELHSEYRFDVQLATEDDAIRQLRAATPYNTTGSSHPRENGVAEVITSMGHRIAYDVVGDGPETIVFIHGWGSNSTYFRRQVAYFSTAARTVTLDLHAHGRSSVPDRGPGSYTVESFADDVEAVIAELGVSSTILVGHSMGGLIALELADRGVARAAVLLDPAVFLDQQFKAQLKTSLVPAVQSDADGTVRRALVDNMLRTGYTERREEVVSDMALLSADLSAAVLEATLDYENAPAAFKRLAVPTLVILAEDPKDDEDALRAVNSSVATHRVATGHFVHLEAPVEVNRLIETFLLARP